MKKIKVLFGIWLILLMGAVVLQSCEEEEEPAQALSAFVIGEWQSQEVMLGETSAVFFYADIEEDGYTLILTDGDNEVPLPKAGYTVDDDANIMTIDQPTFPGDEPSDEVVSFKVEWTVGGDVMTWLPVDPLEDDAPILVWTRSTGI